MELIKGNKELENLNQKLNDEEFLEEYKAKYENYKTSLLPRILGKILVFCGDLVYGKEPSYLKFRAVEIIARVPYQSWSSASYTLLTLFFADEKKAIELSNSTKFARIANDNETMHVVVISHIVNIEHKKVNFLVHSFVPMIFAFFYFWMSYILFLSKKKWSYELNYLFESHAFAQYSLFLKRYGERLKDKKIESDFLKWYGRHPENQYEFFRSIRNDELLHRNESIEEILKLEKN
jgi:ubiquinol oxidase